MTDLLSISIWVFMSLIIKQIDNNNSGTDGGINPLQQQDDLDSNQSGQGTIGGVANGIGFYSFDPIVQFIKIAIIAFSILLLGLSVSAYKKTRLKSIVYAGTAFGLFAVQTLIDYLEDVVKGFDQPYNDVIFYAMTLTILVLFFVAIVRRK